MRYVARDTSYNPVSLPVPRSSAQIVARGWNRASTLTGTANFADIRHILLRRGHPIIAGVNCLRNCHYGAMLVATSCLLFFS